MVTDISRRVLLDAMDEAAAVRLLEEGKDTVGQYRFAHPVIHEAIASQLSRTRKAGLHERVGEILEQVHANDIGNHAEELVHHFGRAGSISALGKTACYALLDEGHALAKQLGMRPLLERIEKL